MVSGVGSRELGEQGSHTRIILVRHGRSTFNEQGRYQGSSDAAVLVEQGRETSRQVGMFLNSVAIDAIYVSPLKRAQETLREILHQMKPVAPVPIHIHQDLREIDLPAWEGLSFQQVKTEFAEEYRCWKQWPHKFQMGELHCFPVQNLYKRAQQFWQEMLPQQDGKTLLVVSHGGTNHALISTALGLCPEHYHRLQQSNCGVSILECLASASPQMQLQALNLTTHMGEVLPKLKEGKQGLRLLLIPIGAPEPHQIQCLAEFLETVPIDFSLTTDAEPLHAIAAELLHPHPHAVQFQVSPVIFPQAWQQTLNAKPHHSSHLVTGLVVADEAGIQHLLGGAIGLTPDQFWRLPLLQGSFSVLHYPSVEHQPILQGMNIVPL
jgi:probable phosphoglycerate mutase